MKLCSPLLTKEERVSFHRNFHVINVPNNELYQYMKSNTCPTELFEFVLSFYL
jgi:hypothetical protein